MSYFLKYLLDILSVLCYVMLIFHFLIQSASYLMYSLTLKLDSHCTFQICWLRYIFWTYVLIFHLNLTCVRSLNELKPQSDLHSRCGGKTWFQLKENEKNVSVALSFPHLSFLLDIFSVIKVIQVIN